jgi:diamine oxidase
MAVTKYKENETCSTSIYNQIDPYSPELDFQKFYEDNDNIRNEDLVAWVTVGLMHVPHTEDIPNTATAGNSASFFLRPYNFFEEDPSMASSDAVLIKPSDKKFSGIKVERFGTPQDPSCKPKDTPLTFTGVYGFA